MRTIIAVFMILTIALAGCASGLQPMYPREGAKPEPRYCVDTPAGHRIALPLSPARLGRREEIIVDQEKPNYGDSDQESPESTQATEPTPAKEGLAIRGFGWALKKLHAGYKVFRRGWNGPAQFIELQIPDEKSKMTLPYIYISTVQCDLVPWLASQTDLLAIDWELYGTVPESSEGVGQEQTPA